MLFITIYWLSLPHTYADETMFIKWTSLLKKKALHIDPKPSPDDVLFIDISQSKTTVEQLGIFGEPSAYHRRVIVDREHLAELLLLMEPYKEEIQHIFLNILFEHPSSVDTFFLEQVKPLESKLLVASRVDTGKYTPPIFDLPHALATYQASGGTILKSSLVFQDTLKTVGLALLERIDKVNFKRNGIVNLINKQLALPTFIIDYKVRPFDFKVSSNLEEKNFTVHQLGDILELSLMMEEEDIAAYFKNKLIIVGDFEANKQVTVFGQMSGPLVLYNTYLTLKNEEYKVSLPWLIFLLIGFWILSYMVFAEVKINWPFLSEDSPYSWLKDTINESFILMAITVLSYFLFNIHINILVLLVYLKLAKRTWKMGLQLNDSDNYIMQKQTSS